MKKRLITAVIEASKTGFGIYSDDLPGITGYGKSIEEAKADIQSAIEDVLEACKVDGTKPMKELNKGNLEFVYKYDMESLFKYFGMFDATNLARKIGLNPSLLRQYKTGVTLAGPKQKERIEKGLHALGRELLSVRL
ncbi:MAG: type II toxin-antitoxin system HicB family antitoxin [Chitinophagaceae bacterium]|nr:type II toxin-antitoxin system HicB family antitoxin [Chitinophagaceae bacterium]